MRVALLNKVALGRQARNQRGSPRVDVLLRVKGELVPIGFPITILNLNRTGLALLSEVRFRSGERLELRLTGRAGPSVQVTAAAVHTQSVPDSPGLFMTGFTFQTGQPGGRMPEADIRDMLAAVAPSGFKI